MQESSSATAVVCMVIALVVELGVFHHKMDGGVIVFTLFIGAVTFFGSRM